MGKSHTRLDAELLLAQAGLAMALRPRWAWAEAAGSPSEDLIAEIRAIVEQLVAALEANGVPHEYRTYAGEGHGFRQMLHGPIAFVPLNQ